MKHYEIEITKIFSSSTKVYNRYRFMGAFPDGSKAFFHVPSSNRYRPDAHLNDLSVGDTICVRASKSTGPKNKWMVTGWFLPSTPEEDRVFVRKPTTY